MAVAISMNVCAEEMPEGYYNNIDGKKDKALKVLEIMPELGMPYVQRYSGSSRPVIDIHS